MTGRSRMPSCRRFATSCRMSRCENGRSPASSSCCAFRSSRPVPRKEPPPPAKKPPVEQLLIGLIPEQNIFKQMERYEPLVEYLSRKTGTKMTLKILPRYGNIIDNFKSSGMDGAFFGSFTYTLAHAKVGVEVLARPVALDNTSTYHGTDLRPERQPHPDRPRHEGEAVRVRGQGDDGRVPSPAGIFP